MILKKTYDSWERLLYKVIRIEDQFKICILKGQFLSPHKQMEHTTPILSQNWD